MLGQVVVQQVVAARKEYEQQGQEDGVDYHVIDHGYGIAAEYVGAVILVVKKYQYSVADEYE